MMEPVYHWLLSLVGIALLIAIASFFPKSEGMKHTLRLIGAAALSTALLAPLLRFDYQTYAGALQQYRDGVSWDAAAMENTQARLSRSIIESECSAYILDKAAQLGVPLQAAEVAVQWSTDGYWLPSAAVLTLPEGTARRDALADAIEADLGIAKDAQEWREGVQTDETE